MKAEEGQKSSMEAGFPLLLNRRIDTVPSHLNNDYSYLPAGIIAQVAEYCSARDQLEIKLLCKSVQGRLPKIPLLNWKYFNESSDQYLKRNGYEAPARWPFKLHPHVVEKDPFTILEFISDSIRSGPGIVMFLPASMGDALGKTLMNVLERPSHPKISLLTLYIASLANSVPAMQFLLLPAKRKELQKEHYQDAIKCACVIGCPEVLKILLDLHIPSANPSHDDNLPIQLSAQKGNSRFVQLLLLDPRVNPASRSNNAIRLAAQNNRLDAFLLLHQDARVNPTDNGNECICDTAREAYLEIFTVLINDQRVNPAARANYCMWASAERGHTAIVALLLADPRVTPAQWDNEALRRASEHGHTSVVRLLLTDPRVDASAHDNYALMSAREKGHLEVVTLLEEHLKSRGLLLNHLGRGRGSSFFFSLLAI